MFVKIYMIKDEGANMKRAMTLSFKYENIIAVRAGLNSQELVSSKTTKISLAISIIPL